MNKDFDTWNGEKKIINDRKVEASYFSGEVWWCNLGLNIGTETDGKNYNFERPVVIIKFWNKDMVWVLPSTTKQYHDRYHYELNVAGTKSFVKLSQIRTISTKRLIRKLGNISSYDFKEIKKRLVYFIQCESPHKGGDSRKAEGH